ncbi:MAG: glucosamine-6-phosphate deaminase [Parcubacteria group bacterium]|nr:glucosamine-6-phosphate deaminase [Parcubacteria group bacterium]
MKVIITKNYDEMSDSASRFVLAHLWRKPDLVLGLPTGETPIGMYERLVLARKKGRADFSRASTFNLDEYAGLSEKDADSFHHFMDRHLFNHVNIKKKNIYLPNGRARDLNAECEQYESAIKDAGRIDLQVLGIAPNGHIGFNEPGTPFAARTHVAQLSEHTRKKNAKHFKEGRVPEQAITMGLGTIMDAKKIALIASGSAKADAVKATVEGRVSKDVPASLLQWHPDVTLIIDEAAASKLERDYASPLLFGEGDVEVLTEQDIPSGKYITVVSPHPDDASISMGGLIAALAKRNRVHIVIATTGYRSVVDGAKPEEVIKIREKEAREESKILGAIPVFLRAEFYDAKNEREALVRDTEKLAAIFNRTKPDLLFVPHELDRHPTHAKSRSIALLALAKHQAQKKRDILVYNYEGLWSLFSEGEFNTVFAYDESLMKKKLKAITAQKSQLARLRFDVAAKSLARLRAEVVPELSLVGYGARAPRLGKYFELFHVTQM